MDRMEQKVEGLRQFTSPYAPEICLLGARLKHDSRRTSPDPIFVFGKGHKLTQALNSLCGEAAERDALYLRSTDRVRPIMNVDLAVLKQVAAEKVLLSGVPEDLGSTGCAAHNTFDTAARLAIAELIERHAALLWWQGDLRPIELGSAWTGRTEIDHYISNLRSGCLIARQTTFYCLGAFGPLRVAVARSEGEDGSEIAIAFAADDTLSGAVKRATLELASVELEVADLCYARRTNAPIPLDSNRGLVARRQEALAGPYAHLFDASKGPVPADSPKSLSLAALGRQLSVDGLAVHIADLSRNDTKLPTCRALFEEPDRQPRLPRGPELSPF
ncbi:MAG: YcaO-like family protein [Paracoccaceae bacterium]